MVTRCFSPSDSVTPCSPTRVSYPFGSASIASWIAASRAAAHVSSGRASGRPNAMFSRSVGREHQRGLEHHGDLAAQRGEAIVPHVDAVDQDVPAVGVIKARQEASGGFDLARPRGAHDRHLPSPVARRDSPRRARGIPVHSRKTTSSTRPRPRALGRKIRARPSGTACSRVEHLEDALDPDPRALGEPPGVEHAVQRAVERGEIRDEDHQGPEAERAVHHVAPRPPTPLPRCRRRSARRPRPSSRSAALVQPPAGGQAQPARRHESALLVVLARERTDDAHGRHRALDEGVHLALALAHRSGSAVDAESSRAMTRSKRGQTPSDRSVSFQSSAT